MVAPLVVEVGDAPPVVVVLLGAREVEVDEAEGDGVLEHAAAVSATSTVARATALRPQCRPFPTFGAYAPRRPAMGT